jgi:predicted metal-dependent HD superfamily phosphohydrolase
LDQLRRRWHTACHGLASVELRDRTFDELVSVYTAPDRHYHDIGHIADCLRELDEHRHLAVNADAIEAALWFHDVVYDGRRSDNEERSAERADVVLEKLGCSAPMRAEVKRLILLTRHDCEPAEGDVDGQLMVDIDLASLALPPDAFDRNGENIRREYPHVDDAAFDRGRAAMLGSFLRRPRIYYTPWFSRRYEQRARENLSRVVSATAAS